MISECRGWLWLPALSLRRVRSKLAAVLVALTVLSAVRAEALAENVVTADKDALSSSQRESVADFLRSYVEKSRYGPDKSTRYSAAAISNTDLVLAYIQGSSWCGSGGCMLLILKPSGASYEVGGKIFLVHTPIFEYSNMVNGLPELGVWVQGGGIDVGYEAILTANRNGKYPFSAVMSRKRSSSKSAKVLIGTDDMGKMLLQ